MGSICSSGSTSTETHSLIVKQITLNNVLLTLVHGDPAIEMVDALVISLDTNLHAAGPVSAGLLKAGGDKLDEAIRSKWADGSSFQPGDVVVTAAGGLFCFNAIHVIAPNPVTVESVRIAFTSILQEAAKLEVQLLSIPPLEISSEEITREKQVEILFQVLANFLREKKLPRLERIRLVSADMGVVKVYESEFSKHFPKWIHSRAVALKQKKDDSS